MRQIQIIRELAINVGNIWGDFVNETKLPIDSSEDFHNRCVSVVAYCQNLYVDSAKYAPQEFIIEKISHLITTLMKYRLDYDLRRDLLEQWKFNMMNSFLDTVIESYKDYLDEI